MRSVYRGAGVSTDIHPSDVRTSQNHVSFPKLSELYSQGVSTGMPSLETGLLPAL